MIRKLFSANPARIGRFDGPPTSDAVPASLVDGTPGELKADLIALLGKENVLHRAIDLVRYASDASPYRLVPQVVVLPRTTDDIVKLFRYCRETGRHLGCNDLSAELAERYGYINRALPADESPI